MPDVAVSHFAIECRGVRKARFVPLWRLGRPPPTSPPPTFAALTRMASPPASYVDLLESRLDQSAAEHPRRPRAARNATVDAMAWSVVGPKANEIAMAKAEDVGSAWVAVSNTNHFGIAGYYPLMALKRDLIGWAMCNSTAFVAPLWGVDRMLGTNPIAFAFPAGEEPPIVIDFATSAAPFGKIEIAKRKGASIPSSWAIDRHGNPATEPDQVIDGGALLPLAAPANPVDTRVHWPRWWMY